MKNLFFTFLALFMLYFGLQNMTITGDQMQTVFVLSWLCLAIFVIGGNFAQFLYRPKRPVSAKQVKAYKESLQRKRQRQTMR